MNGRNRSLNGTGLAALIAVIALVVLGFGGSSAFAEEPIVGLWQGTLLYGETVVQNVISGWTAGGLEFEDYASLILLGHICYGHWVKLQGRTYGQTHPYFEYDPSTGEWAGTSGVLNYTVTVSNDGKTFSGKVSGKFGVPGPNPYASGGNPVSGLTIKATKIAVDVSQLPPA